MGKLTITFQVEIDKSKIQDFSTLIAMVFSMAMQIGRELARRLLETLDRDIAATRDTRRYRHKGKRKTSIKTKLGVIEYERNIYLDMASEEPCCVYLLDEAMQMEKIGQVSADMCKAIAGAACASSFRAAAQTVEDMTGMSISPQGAWNIFQQLGEQERERVERHEELAKQGAGVGCIETELLYEENDGVWLKLQGEDREKFGSSKEMKVGIAYDGVQWDGGEDGKGRRILDNKVAYASFESAKEFLSKKEGLIASRFDVNTIKLRIVNGDGAAWIQNTGEGRIPVLDVFHRNKKLTECVRDMEFANLLKDHLYAGRIQELLDCLEAQINSVEDEDEKKPLKELYRYYKENREALTSYHDRGIPIPDTREPGEIHHARLGSMESNVFTLIGNRMKDRRACWSIHGADNMALLLGLSHTTGFECLFAAPEPLPEPEPEFVDTGAPLSASKVPLTVGSGTEFYNSVTLPNLKWLRGMTACQSPVDIIIR